MPSDASERWLAMSQQFRIGPKRRGGLLRSAGSDYQVAPGQLRQASWQGADAAVLIAEVDDQTAQARVFPATLEPGVESTAAVVVEAEASPLHGPIIVWPANADWIPFTALDSIIAIFSAALLRTVTDVGSGQESSSGGVRPGRLDPPLTSGAELAIDELLDAMDVLKDAPGFEVQESDSPRTRLQVPLPVVMAELNVPQPRAMAILAGRELLTLDEATALADAAGLAISEVLAAVSPLPRDLWRELQEPRWRPQIRLRALGGDEAQARMRLGYQAYQLAARESGSGRDLWRQRIDAVLAAEGGRSAPSV